MPTISHSPECSVLFSKKALYFFSSHWDKYELYFSKAVSTSSICWNSDNEEKYFSFYNYLKNENYFISGEELLENAREQYTEFLNSDGDAAGAEGDVFDVGDNWIAEYPDTDEETEDTSADDTQTTETEPTKEEPEVPNPQTGHYPTAAVLAAVSAAAIFIIGANKYSCR